MSQLTMSDTNTGGLSLPTRMHRAARRLTGRLGVHGYGLLWIAFVWWAIGLRALLLPAGSQPKSGILGFIPDNVALVLWWGAALLCLSAAIDREGPRRDGFALSAAVAAPIIFGSSYLAAWLINGNPIGWYVAIYYFALVGLVTLVAAIPDPPGHRR